MVILTCFIGVLAILCSWKEIVQRIGFFHLNLLWILGGVLGVFMALDLFLFFFFWEMMLVPMYFLIALWGHSVTDGKSRINAATKFFIYTQVSGLIMLVAILGLVLTHHAATGVFTFDYQDLLNTPMSKGVQWLLMLGFFIAFAVKMPLVPLHGWLPDAHSQAPTAGSVDLAGILLKTAAYGLLRFALPLFPEASAEFAPYAMVLGLIGIVYGAIVAFAQTDIKRLVAYTSISHMGFVMIAIYSGSELALQGAVVQMIAHGLRRRPLHPVRSALRASAHPGPAPDGRAVGPSALPARRDAVLLGRLSGDAGHRQLRRRVPDPHRQLPGCPVLTIIATFGLVLASVYSLIMLQRACFGTPATRASSRLDSRELVMMMTIAGLLVLLGVYPQPVLDTAGNSLLSVLHWYALPFAGALQ